LFESPHWFRKLVATLSIFSIASVIATFWVGFFGILIGIGLAALIIGLLHRRAMRIRGQRQAGA
jgi:hypothetical protein